MTDGTRRERLCEHDASGADLSVPLRADEIEWLDAETDVDVIDG